LTKNLPFREAFSVNAFLKGLKKALPKKQGFLLALAFTLSFLLLYLLLLDLAPSWIRTTHQALGKLD